MKPIKNIVWTVDAFQSTPQQLKPTAKWIESYAKTFGAKVHLVFAYKVPQLLLSPKSFLEFQKPYLNEAQKHLDQIAKLLDSKIVGKSLVTTNSPKDDHNILQLTLNAAKKLNADMIAAATHGRNALTKFFIGSFSEGLVQHSRLPLLLVNPHLKNQAPTQLLNWIVPTDFSRSEPKWMQSLLSLAKAKKAHVHFIHGLVNEYIPVVVADAALMGTYFSPDSESFKLQSDTALRQLTEYVGLSHKVHVHSDAELYTAGGSISDVILKSQKYNKGNLIFVRTRAGRPGHAGMGSVSKKILRTAPVPVVIDRA